MSNIQTEEVDVKILVNREEDIGMTEARTKITKYTDNKVLSSNNCVGSKSNFRFETKTKESRKRGKAKQKKGEVRNKKKTERNKTE